MCGAGLVFRPPHSPIVLLIFASGKIVCTGGKSCDDILCGFQRLYPLIRPFIRKRENACMSDNGGESAEEVSRPVAFCSLVFSRALSAGSVRGRLGATWGSS